MFKLADIGIFESLNNNMLDNIYISNVKEYGILSDGLLNEIKDKYNDFYNDMKEIMIGFKEYYDEYCVGDIDNKSSDHLRYLYNMVLGRKHLISRISDEFLEFLSNNVSFYDEDMYKAILEDYNDDDYEDTVLSDENEDVLL